MAMLVNCQLGLFLPFLEALTPIAQSTFSKISLKMAIQLGRNM